MKSKKIKQIQKWWNNHLPQMNYSDKKLYSREFFDEVERKRYSIYYNFLPEVMEFDKYKNKKVLEIGCGIGTDIIQFAKHGANTTAIDLTERAVEITKKRFKVYNLEGQIFKFNGEKLPFKSNYFDLVYSIGVMHHTPNIQKAIDEAYRVLKPYGNLIVLLYSKGWKHYIFRVVLSRLWPEKKKDKNTELWGSPLTYVFSRREVVKLFKNNVMIKKYRLGVLFDFKGKAFGMMLFPSFISNLAYMLKLEKLFGENWIISGRKSRGVE